MTVTCVVVELEWKMKCRACEQTGWIVILSDGGLVCSSEDGRLKAGDRDHDLLVGLRQSHGSIHPDYQLQAC